MSFYAAENLTYDEVMARAERVQARRQQMRRLACVAAAPAPPPAPPPTPVPEPALDPEPMFRLIGPRAVMRATGKCLSLTLEDLLSNHHKPPAPRARQIMYYISRAATRKSFLEIAKAYSRDHSTILYGFRKIEKLLCIGDPFAVEDVGAIMAELGVPWEPPPAGSAPSPKIVFHQKWSDDELAEVKRACEAGIPIASIARRMGRSHKATYAVAYEREFLRK